MNAIASFRKCTLTDKELIEAVDKGFDEIYRTGKIPTRRIPARPNEDLDLLIGELILRFAEIAKVKNDETAPKIIKVMTDKGIESVET